MAVEVKPMDLKKNHKYPSTAQAPSTTSLAKRVYNFVGDIKSEFRKITWTNRNELIAYTKIVVGTTFFLGMGVYCVDLAIQLSLWMIDSAISLLFG